MKINELLETKKSEYAANLAMATKGNVHRVSVTVSDPNHPMVSKRKERIEKIVKVTAPDKQAARAAVISHYKKKGFRVHDDHYVGLAEETVDEAKQRLDPKCWTGYKKQGTKMKGGVRVNNCVPKEDVAMSEAATAGATSSGSIATGPSKNKGNLIVQDQGSTTSVHYVYTIPNGKATEAFRLGLKRLKDGVWYSENQRNVQAEFKFGNGVRKSIPKVLEKMLPTSSFAGTPKNKLGPAAHLKGKMKRPSRPGDLVGGSS